MEEEERLRALASPGGGPRLEIGTASLLALVYGARLCARCKLNCFDAAVPCSPPASPDSQSPHAASDAQNAIAFRLPVGPRRAAVCFGRRARQTSQCSNAFQRATSPQPVERRCGSRIRASACTTQLLGGA